MNDLISVIISAYNHENYIQESMKSIINQTYQNLEFIIIDDGSSDSTFAKINELKDICEKRFSRFISLTHENKGVCLTMNEMLDLTQGKYVFMLASDDVAAPNAIEVLHDFLSQNENYALAVGENLFIDSESKQCYWDMDRNAVYTEEEAAFTSFSDFLIKVAQARNLDFLSDEFGSYSSLLMGNYIPNGYLVRRNIFDKTGYYTEEAPLEDYYLMLQISKYAKMKYIPQPLFYYRWHSANTASQRAKMVDHTQKTFWYEVNNIQNCKDPNIQRMLLNHLDWIIKTAKEQINNQQNV